MTKYKLTSQADWEAGTVPAQADPTSEPGKVKLYRPTATFARASIAYNPDTGAEVASGEARRVRGRFHNLLTLNQSSVETDTSGFLSWNGASLSRVTSLFRSGSASLRVITPGVTTEGAYTTQVSVRPSTQHTGSVHVRGAGTVHMGMVEVNAAGGYVTQTNSNPVILSEDTWQRLSVTKVLAASTAKVYLAVWTSGTQAITFYVDDLMLNEGGLIDWLPGGTGQALFIEEGTTNIVVLPNDWTSYTGKSTSVTVTGDDATYAPFVDPSDRLDFTTTGGQIYKRKTGLASAIGGQTWTGSAKVYVPAATAIFLGITDAASWSVSRIEKLSLNAGWNEILITHTFPGTLLSTSIDFLLANSDVSGGAAVGSGSGASSVGEVTIWILYSQVEQKPYDTSWQTDVTARAAEAFTVPTAGWAKGSWTVRFWYKPGSKLTKAWITPWGMQAGAGHYEINIRPTSGYLRLDVAIPAQQLITDNVALVAGEWVRIAATGDGSTIKLFKNGALVGSLVYSEPVDEVGSVMYVGANRGGTEIANGPIEDFEFLTEALSEAQIAADYASTSPAVSTANTLALFPFDGDLLSLYPSEATIITKTLDLGAARTKPLHLWRQSVTPTGTTVLITRVRTSANGVDWGDWAAPVAGLTPWAPQRYVQFEIQLATTDTRATPTLTEATIQDWNPIAGVVRTPRRITAVVKTPERITGVVRTPRRIIGVVKD